MKKKPNTNTYSTFHVFPFFYSEQCVFIMFLVLWRQTLIIQLESKVLWLLYLVLEKYVRETNAFDFYQKFLSHKKVSFHFKLNLNKHDC